MIKNRRELNLENRGPKPKRCQKGGKRAANRKATGQGERTLAVDFGIDENATKRADHSMLLGQVIWIEHKFLDHQMRFQKTTLPCMNESDGVTLKAE